MAESLNPLHRQWPRARNESVPERIKKVQRWLDLIAYLVGRRLPVSVEELMERLPAYAGDWVIRH